MDDSLARHISIYDENDKEILHYLFGNSGQDWQHNYIRKNGSPDVYRTNDNVFFLLNTNTLLHEVMHGIVYQYGMVQTMDKFDKEEKIVNTLTNGLMNVFVDNPWLMEYIKEQIDKEYGKSSSQTE